MKADHVVSRLYRVESIPGTGDSLNQTQLKQYCRSQGQIMSQEWPDPRRPSGSQIDSSSLNKTIINSTDSLGH